MLANPSCQFDLKQFHLHWMPPGLSFNQKSNRMSSSKLILTESVEYKPAYFEQVVTGDKLWFFRNDPRDFLWVASIDELPHRIKK
jgi:hypothetical protein